MYNSYFYYNRKLNAKFMVNPVNRMGQPQALQSTRSQYTRTFNFLGYSYYRNLDSTLLLPDENHYLGLHLFSTETSVAD